MAWYDPITTFLSKVTPSVSEWVALLNCIKDEINRLGAIVSAEASTTSSGLMPKGDGNPYHFYSSDGTQKIPPGGDGWSGTTGTTPDVILVAGAVEDEIAGSGTTIASLKTQIFPISWQPQQMNFDVPPSMGGSGAELKYEKLSNGIVQSYMEFTNTTAQYVFCEGIMPEDWDTGTVDITAYLRWKSASSSTNKVKWLIYGKRFTSGASRDFALTDLLATIEQANGGAEYQNETAETTLIDMGGSGRNFIMMIVRDYGTESPSLAAAAGLLSVEIYPTRTLA